MYKEANWVRFRELVDEKLNQHQLAISNDIDSSIDFLTGAISSAMDQCIPKKCFTTKNHFSRQLRDCIAEKKRLRRAYFRRKLKDSGLKTETDRLNVTIRDSIDARDSKIFMNKLKQIRPDAKMYKNISKLLGNGKKTVPELKASDGSLVSNPLDKANAIAAVYDKVHRQNRDMGDPNFDSVVMSEVLSFSQISASNLVAPRSTDPEEIRRILKSIKNKKSNGPDAIPNLVLKKLSWLAHEYIAKIIDCVLRMGYYPDSWKTAHVIPIV